MIWAFTTQQENRNDRIHKSVKLNFHKSVSHKLNNLAFMPILPLQTCHDQAQVRAMLPAKKLRELV